MLLTVLTACIGSNDTITEDELPGIGALGFQTHDEALVHNDVLATADDGLNTPRDLEFNPEVPGELWVVNRTDDSTTLLHNAGTDDQWSEHLIDPFALHFMEEVSSIAFGQPGTFGTCQESRNTYNGQSSPNNFMGPSLWTSDLEVYAQSNEEAIDYLSDLFGQYVDLGSHLDMLHESPMCMGMAWSHDNVYWVYDGWNQAIARYDFADDHGAGYDDHSDGIIGKYATGEIQMRKDTPSHMELDHETGWLYFADTGNNRVARLDTNSGTRGSNLPSMEPGVDHYKVDDAIVETVLDGPTEGMEAPSGLAIHDGVLYVGDRLSGTIYAYDLVSFELIDYLDTNAGKLYGIEVVSEDEIWYVDGNNDEVRRLTSRPNRAIGAYSVEE